MLTLTSVAGMSATPSAADSHMPLDITTKVRCW